MNTVKYMTFFALVTIICGVSYGFTNSVYSGTYVDANATNTVRVGGGTWYSADGAAAAANNWWRLRSGFANPVGGSGTIYESDAMGAEDAPILKTAVAGQPYMYYDVYVVFWSPSGSGGGGQDWLIWAGIQPNALTLYCEDTGGQVYTGATPARWTGAIEGNRWEEEGVLSLTAADASGNVSIYVDDTTINLTNNRTWYDGMVYNLVNIPFHPSPDDGAVNVPLATSTLSFTSMRDDPNHFDQEDPNVASHKVYFDNDPNLADADDLLATLPKGTNQATIPTTGDNALKNNETYYWRVDEVLDDGSVVTGVVWTFETVKTMPDFNPPNGFQPQNTSAMLGDDAVLTASAGGGTYTYQWYKGASGVVTNPVVNATGHISGAGTNQLTITTQVADEGTYWCRATNTKGSADSNAAIIVVKRKVAHWTLDAVVGGQYLDSSGESHPANVTGSPVPVAGVAEKLGNAIPFNGTSTGCANSGTWNPSQYSGQISVSLWARWGGQAEGGATWQGLVSKEVSFAADQMMWQLEIDQTNNNLVLKNGSNVAVTATPMAIGQWEHIVFTFDGTTGRIYRNVSSVVSGGFSLTSKTDAPLSIGASANNAGTYSFIFNGTLDDIRVFNYAISPLEVALLYTDVIPYPPICMENLAMDFSGPAGTPDCKVNLYDFAAIAADWLQCNLVPSAGNCP